MSAEIKRRYVAINGSQQIIYTNTIEHALSGASYTATGIIPAGAVELGVTSKVLTAITGASSYDLGDGSTADLYADNAAIAKGTETGSVEWKSSCGLPRHRKTAGDVVVTANGSNFTGGKIQITAHYYTVEI